MTPLSFFFLKMHISRSKSWQRCSDLYIIAAGLVEEGITVAIAEKAILAHVSAVLPGKEGSAARNLSY